MFKKIILIALIFFVAGCEDVVFPAQVDDNQAVLAVIGEAENQGLAGMRVIASAIRNRGTLRGVYGARSPRVVHKKYSKDIYNQARQAWHDSAVKDYARGATHWGSKIVDRAWINKMMCSGYILTLDFKDHVFFKER